MGHCINIYIGKKEEMNDPLIKYVELKHGIVAIMDWPGNRSAENYENSQLLAKRSIALISTDYFGGWGEQTATLYIDGKLAYKGDSGAGDPEPINNALRFMGVVAEGEDDEFDTVGLGHYRSNRDFDEEADEDLNLGEDEEDDRISGEMAASLMTKEWSTPEVIKLINDFYDHSYGGITPETKDEWIKNHVSR
jgi:hypothetical protein